MQLIAIVALPHDARLLRADDDTSKRLKYKLRQNPIESLNYSLRKRLKTRGTFPNDESIVTVLYLALQQMAKRWTRPIRDWKAALNQFVILFGERVPV